MESNLTTEIHGHTLTLYDAKLGHDVSFMAHLNGPKFNQEITFKTVDEITRSYVLYGSKNAYMSTIDFDGNTHQLIIIVSSFTPIEWETIIRWPVYTGSFNLVRCTFKPLESPIPTKGVHDE